MSITAKQDTYGSYELARFIVEGIRTNRLGIVKYLVRDASHFDSGRPDSMDNFKIPPSP